METSICIKIAYSFKRNLNSYYVPDFLFVVVDTKSTKQNLPNLYTGDCLKMLLRKNFHDSSLEIVCLEISHSLLFFFNSPESLKQLHWRPRLLPYNYRMLDLEAYHTCFLCSTNKEIEARKWSELEEVTELGRAIVETELSEFYFVFILLHYWKFHCQGIKLFNPFHIYK